MRKKYTISIQLQWDAAKAIPLTLVSASKEWECIAAPYRKGRRITIPADQFHFKSRVHDERRYLYAVNARGDAVLIPHTEENSSAGGPIVLVLESPHLHEYRYTDDSGNTVFEPIGPLMNAKSKIRVEKYLPAMLQSVGIQPANQVVILSNPVPFQASIVRLWELQFQRKMLSIVRNRVWRELYTATHQGTLVMEDDFKARLDQYQPSAVINACTVGVKNAVRKTLKSSAYAVFEVTQHPSIWSSLTRMEAVK